MYCVAANSAEFDFQLTTHGLQVKPSGGDADMLLPWQWLRDHCHAEHSFNYATHQRKQTPIELDPNIAAVELHWLADKNELTVRWNNGEQDGKYPADFFHRIIANPQAIGEQFITAKLWDAGIIDNEPTVEFKDVADGDSAWLMKLAEVGFVLIQNAPPNKEGAKAIANAIGYVRETHFGGLGVVEAGGAYADTAYGNEELGSHTDATYSHDAPGVQLLLFADMASKGGESTLVDGFRLAEIMQKEDDALYKFLCALPVPGKYIGDNVHLRACRAMFRHDVESGRLVQVSYNCYDRDTFLLSPADCEQFYRGVRRFHQLASSPDLLWQRKINPGTAVIFNNWRLLHGRRAFSGRRKFHTCYLDYEILQSKLRVTFGKTL